MAKHGSKQAFQAAAFVRKAYLYAFLQVSTKKAAGYRTGRLCRLQRKAIS